jgi:hypothetical protein
VSSVRADSKAKRQPSVAHCSRRCTPALASQAARPCPERRPFFARRTAGLRRQDSVPRPQDPCPCVALPPPLLHLPELLPCKGSRHGFACAPLLPCMDITLCVDDSIRLARRVAPSSQTPPVVRGDDGHRPARPPVPSRSTSRTVQADHGCRPARRAHPSSVTAIAVRLDGAIRPARRALSSSSTAPNVHTDSGRRRARQPRSSAPTAPAAQLDDPRRPPDGPLRPAGRRRSSSPKAGAVTLDDPRRRPGRRWPTRSTAPVVRADHGCRTTQGGDTCNAMIPSLQPHACRHATQGPGSAGERLAARH